MKHTMLALLMVCAIVASAQDKPYAHRGVVTEIRHDKGGWMTASDTTYMNIQGKKYPVYKKTTWPDLPAYHVVVKGTDGRVYRKSFRYGYASAPTFKVGDTVAIDVTDAWAPDY